MAPDTPPKLARRPKIEFLADDTLKDGLSRAAARLRRNPSDAARLMLEDAIRRVLEGSSTLLADPIRENVSDVET